MHGFRVTAKLPCGLTYVDVTATDEAHALAQGRLIFDLPDSELFVESYDSEVNAY